MIPLKTFVEGFTSFWRAQVPRSEEFVRRMNLSYERISPPIAANGPSERRSVVNEMSTRMFQALVKRQIDRSLPDHSYLTRLEQQCKEKISRLAGGRGQVAHNLSEGEQSEAHTLALVLYDYFLADLRRRDCVLDPPLKGCGLIDACEADVFARHTLYEIKAGDRGFRSIELRQLLVYCALNYASGQYAIEKVGVVNPRQGIEFNYPIDDLAIEVAGKTSAQLFQVVIGYLTAGGVSI